MRTTDAILPLFRSDAQARIVARVFLDESGLPLTHLARDAGVGKSQVHREVERLEKAGLVTSERVGNVRLVRPNAASPYYHDLRGLVLKAFGPVAALSNALAGIEGIEEAYLFGSWAARYLGEPGPPPSDIDVLVVGDPDPDQVYGAARTVEQRLGYDVNPTIVSRRSWKTGRSGYRVANKPGAHVAVGEYAASEGILDEEEASRFDRMRRNRHRSEYDLAFFEATEVERDLVYVEGVIGAVGDRLG